VSLCINLLLAGVIVFMVIELCKAKLLLMETMDRLREKPKVEMIFKRPSAEAGKKSEE